MSLGLISHHVCLKHAMGAGHPESPARLEAVLRALSEHPRLSALPIESAPRGEREDWERVHPAAHGLHLEAQAPEEGPKEGTREGMVQLDADTLMNPHSLEAAYRALGAVCKGLDDVMAGRVQRSMALVRPPGHHAEPDRVMGFCFFNTIAVAAARALAQHGLRRVAVVDFDVHHGNGTEAAVRAHHHRTGSESLRFISSHQMPLYPGTGARSDETCVLNVPLAPLTDGAEMRRCYEGEILPALDDWAPELILVSAGFDAHEEDPLAQLHWQDEDFGWLGARLLEVAERHSDGRLVGALEGGYATAALGRSVCAFLESWF